MLHRLIAVIACCLLLQAAVASDSVDLSGEWHFDVLKSPNGPGKRAVLFRQDGERVIGFIESNSASGRFVGSLDGRRLAFTAVLEFGGQPFGADYEATVDGDSKWNLWRFLQGNAGSGDARDTRRAFSHGCAKRWQSPFAR